MGIPDPRPKSFFGDYTINQAYYSKTWRVGKADGVVYNVVDNSGTMRLIYSKRSGKSSNRRQPLSGTSTLWISPSTYMRSVVRYEPLQMMKAIGERTVYYQVAEAFPFITNIGGSIKGNPEFWSNGFLSPVAIISVNRRARLTTECLLKIKSQKLDLSADLATAAQTFNMFARHASTYFKALSAARKRDWKGLWGALGLSGDIKKRGSVSAGYLEYIYGWKPLMQDIYGAWELLNEQMPKARLVHAVRKLSKTHHDQYNAQVTGYNRKWVIQEYASGYDKLSLTGRISDDYARDCARAGLINPLTVAWEVVPYSFLIDWGMPIGNCLEAMDATRGLTFVGGYFSTRQEGTWSVEEQMMSIPDGGGAQWTTTQPGLLAAFAFSNVREKVSAWPFPAPYAKSPFSSGHLTNALALFRSSTRKRW